MLNLEDNLTRAEIETRVLQYERECGFHRLCANLMLTLRDQAAGYIVHDYREGGESDYLGSTTHFRTREEAEAHFLEDERLGRVLVHVIASDHRAASPVRSQK